MSIERTLLVEYEQLVDEEFATYVHSTVVPTMQSFIHNRTGALSASIHGEKQSDHVYWVGSRLYYGKYVESGHGPVKPVVKRALYWPELGHPIARTKKKAEAQHIVRKTIDALQ